VPGLSAYHYHYRTRATGDPHSALDSRASRDPLTAVQDASDEDGGRWGRGMDHGRGGGQQLRLVGKVIETQAGHGGAQKRIFNDTRRICIVVYARHVTFRSFRHVRGRSGALFLGYSMRRCTASTWLAWRTFSQQDFHTHDCF